MTSTLGLAKTDATTDQRLPKQKAVVYASLKMPHAIYQYEASITKEMTQTALSPDFSNSTAQTPLTRYSYTVHFQIESYTLTIIHFAQIFVAIPPLPIIAFPLSLSPTTFSPSLPSTLKLSALIFPSTCAAPPTTVRLGSINALISYGLPSLDVLPTFSYPNGLLNASEIFRECARILSPQLWFPRLPDSGDGLFPVSFGVGTGAGRGVTNCSYVGSGRSAN